MDFGKELKLTYVKVGCSSASLAAEHVGNVRRWGKIHVHQGGISLPSEIVTTITERVDLNVSSHIVHFLWKVTLYQGEFSVALSRLLLEESIFSEVSVPAIPTTSGGISARCRPEHCELKDVRKTQNVHCCTMCRTRWSR